MTSRETPELQDLKEFPAQSVNPERRVPPELRASLVMMLPALRENPEWL